MATTAHLGLKKPDYSDPADVQDINDNMDTLDDVIWAIKNKGAANAGKFLIVGNDGEISLLSVANASGGAF